MGSGLLDEGAPLRSKTYSEQFEEMCPYYLNMGMTYEQYWDGDPEMVKSYRKAYKLRCDSENQRAWLHGRYVYEAICCASPILHAFSKKGTKPHPFPKNPLGEETEKPVNNTNVDFAKFTAFISKFNQKFKEGR